MPMNGTADARIFSARRCNNFEIQSQLVQVLFTFVQAECCPTTTSTLPWFVVSIPNMYKDHGKCGVRFRRFPHYPPLLCAASHALLAASSGDHSKAVVSARQAGFAMLAGFRTGGYETWQSVARSCDQVSTIPFVNDFFDGFRTSPPPEDQALEEGRGSSPPQTRRPWLISSARALGRRPVAWRHGRNPDHFFNTEESSNTYLRQFRYRENIWTVSRSQVRNNTVLFGNAGWGSALTSWSSPWVLFTETLVSYRSLILQSEKR